MQQTFLERAPPVSDEAVDALQDLLRRKIDLKTGYAEPCAQARVMHQTLRSLDLADDATMTKESFRLIMEKMNCGEDRAAVDALFHRFDRKDVGRVAMKDFADGLFGLRRVPNADPECRCVIKAVRERLLERGENSFRGLQRTLRVMDNNGNKKLDRTELKYGLQNFGLSLSEAELDTLMHYFDSDGSGHIDVTEFVVGLRPEMNEARTALVRLAFLRLDKNESGEVTLNDLKALYCAEKHPAVLRGTRTVDDVMLEFMSMWDKNGDGVITEQEFIDYYKGLSASIDNDAYFELMIRNAWRIAGGSGQAANTANLRVLVTHLDGTQTVEGLINCLGVDRSDPRSITAALRKQGVTDILKVETSS